MSTDTPFLIAHKVRGEPAFDIAIKQRCAICGGVGSHAMLDFETGEPADYEGPACDECDGLGHWWICSTSGHRAYPWWHIELATLNVQVDEENEAFGYMLDTGPMPEGIPDHYRVNATPRGKVVEAGRSLLASLGLTKPKAPIRRRV